jgi:hypothetical protein
MISRVLRTLAAFGGIAHSPRRAYSRVEYFFDVCLLPREMGFEDVSSSALDVSVLHAFCKRFVGQSS